MHEGAKRLRASEIISMSSSLVYYNWLIVRTLRRNIAHSPFEIRRFFKRFVPNVALINQEWLKLGVALFCRRKERIQQLLLTTVLTSLVVMTTSRNWLKDTKDTKVCWALKLNEWAKACREHMDESNLTEMSLLTDNTDARCEH